MRVRITMNKLLLVLILLVAGCRNVDNGTRGGNLSKDKSGLENKLLKFDNFRTDSSALQSLEEFPLSADEKKALLEQVIGHYAYYSEADWAVKSKPLTDNFIFLELNADGKPDLLFQGWSGGEPECVRIHFSSDTGFAAPLVFYQHVKNLDIENGQIRSLTTLNPGCCGEYIQQELTYVFDAEPKHKLVSQRARIKALPGEYEILETPIAFTTGADTNVLRGTPLADDTATFVYDRPNEGNALAMFKRGVKGFVWAIDSSDPATEWWYVEMEPVKDSLDFDLFKYLDEHKQMRRMGWMNSTTLKK